MSELDFSLQLNRFPDRQLILNRVTIFLGTNGTGKSKLLQEFKAKPQDFGNREVIYVEGGRTIQIIDSLQLDSNTFHQFSNTLSAKSNHKSSHTANLAGRVKNALLLIDKLGQDIEVNHSRAVVSWQNGGKVGECPVREKPPLERLFELFMEIFPTITLDYNHNTKQMICQKNGNTYMPSQLSDGEKQVFSLLADIVILGEDNRLVIADEPELNLNPGLANRVWDLIENELPESVFVYATHSVSFAMRANVEKIFVLSNDTANIAEIGSIKDIDERELSALLGSIPALLSSSKALAVEGKENSLDPIVYRWLINSKTVEVVSVGGSDEVQAVANKTGVWDTLAPSVKIVGIIDRDYKPSALLDTINLGSCKVLVYHEIESYLCHPVLVQQVATGIGSMEVIPSIADIENLIVEEFEKELLQIVARRVIARATIKLAVAVEKRILSQITDAATMEKTLIEAAEDETTKAYTELGPDKVKEIMKEELDECTRAKNARSIDDILKLMPGKNLLNKIAPIAGCKNALAFARAASKHGDIDKIEKLAELREVLISALQ